MKNNGISSNNYLPILQKHLIEIDSHDYKKGDNILNKIFAQVENSNSKVALLSEYSEHTDSWDRDWDKSYD